MTSSLRVFPVVLCYAFRAESGPERPLSQPLRPISGVAPICRTPTSQIKFCYLKQVLTQDYEQRCGSFKIRGRSSQETALSHSRVGGSLKVIIYTILPHLKKCSKIKYIPVQSAVAPECHQSWPTWSTCLVLSS